MLRAGQRRKSSTGRGSSSNNNNNNNNGDADNASSHAMGDSYRETSGNQYSAHRGCQDLLLGCANRLRERQDRAPKQEWKIADLGSADGSNSIRTLEVFLEALNSSSRDNDGASSRPARLHIVFEEHPSSDEARLTETVSSWLDTKNRGGDDGFAITGEVLLKSFYEPLFEADSIDFCMSYICLHWLDSSDTRTSDGIRGWSRLHLADGGRSPSAAEDTAADPENFLQVSERTAPPALRALWKRELADPHLAKFLTLRARELRPGGDLLVAMVGHPNGLWRPEKTHESPLLRAMRRCVSEGSLRRSVLARTVVPYYLRTPADVTDALALARETASEDPGDPVHALELLEVRSYECPFGDGGGGNGMEGARDLFWAIHGGAVVHTGGATEDEVEAIRNQLVRSFDESYDAVMGTVPVTFVACVFRKSPAGS